MLPPGPSSSQSAGGARRPFRARLQLRQACSPSFLSDLRDALLSVVLRSSSDNDGDDQSDASMAAGETAPRPPIATSIFYEAGSGRDHRSGSALDIRNSTTSRSAKVLGLCL
ncbi:hypothetical protein DIPPA_19724 [Diplonema papillatum]|nr:hypothetical protein DIPPA_19724 [Diplonema papillatum]